MAVFKDKEKTKDGRQWYFVSRKKIGNETKQFKSKKYLTKREASEAEALFLLRRDNPDLKKFSIVANDYFIQLEKTRKQSTIYTYKKDYNNHLKPFYGDLDINSINSLVIDKWCLEMEEKELSVDYLNKIYNILTNILSYAMKIYGLEANYATIHGRFQKKNDTIIQDKDKLRYITKEEFDTFISFVDDPMYYAIFNFLFYTGCRKGEMIALKWSDIDFENDTITIDKTLNEEVKGKALETSTKNNQNRTIKINKTLKEVMLKYKCLVSSKSDFEESFYVFGNKSYLSKTTLDRNKHKYFQLSGVREITIHEFRHSHVSLLVNEYIKTSKEKNMKVDTAKFFLMMSSRMGHTIEVMQSTYMHLFPTIQDEIVDLLDNL